LEEARMRIPKRCTLLSLFLFALILTPVGCEGPGKPVKVKGIVTLDGKPLPGVTVTFAPIGTGRPASGLTESDGSFRLTTFRTEDGALPGEYKVVVVAPEARDEVVGRNPETLSYEQKKADRMTMTPMGKAAAAKKKSSSSIPAKYGDVGQTPLREVVPPDGTIEVALRSKP
jgi:hypothetical protein